MVGDVGEDMGLSVSSRDTEDTYLLRGATIPYIEYVQVGKGRDVGMQQIYKFNREHLLREC